jgi:hypothetical protein
MTLYRRAVKASLQASSNENTSILSLQGEAGPKSPENKLIYFQKQAFPQRENPF